MLSMPICSNGLLVPTCPCCAREDETIIHVLRDCVHATQVWPRLVPSSFDCREWIFNNLIKKGMEIIMLLGILLS